mgnify:CR=1 FL=1
MSMLAALEAENWQLQQKCEKIPGYKAEAEVHREWLKERDRQIIDQEETICCLRRSVEDLQEDRSSLIAMTTLIQVKLQSSGSPPQGGIMVLAQWVVDTTVERIARLEAQLEKRFQEVIVLSDKLKFAEMDNYAKDSAITDLQERIKAQAEKITALSTH